MAVNQPQKSILAADDDVVTLTLVERALNEAGFLVHLAASGEQAIEVATTTRLDLAVLDYRLPGLSGLEAGKAIHQITGNHFIVMSVHSDRELTDQAADDGALGFVPKPLDIFALVTQVRIGLERSLEITRLKSTIENLEQHRSDAIAAAVTSARSVNTAVGVLMERLRLPRAEVHAQLVRRARDERRRLVELCEEIIRNRELDYLLPKKN